VEDALSTTRLPLPVARSPLPFFASTVKAVLPTGVEPVVSIVRVDIRVVTEEPKFSELGENEYVTPLGNADVIVRFTPLREPLPPFVTVTV
jgi:hypothetical protein